MNKHSETIESLIAQAAQPITLENLPALQEEYISLINKIIETSPKKPFLELDADLRPKDPQLSGIEQKEDYTVAGSGENGSQITQMKRIVLVGDIHCDFTALKAILTKLAQSDYDYYANATFLFMGDYIDRGSSPFQTLRLILKLKEYLGDRCIMLRGNHDSFYYSDESSRFMSPVSPSDTIDFFTEYLDAGTIEAFKNLFDILPWFVLLKRKEKSWLITHGSIPRDDLAEFFSLDAIRELTLPLETDSKEKVQMRRCLNSMTWGDPVEAEMKYGSGMTRFEFGSGQFDEFMKAQGFTHLVRGHEPKLNGYERMYDDRLVTLFSSGGLGNKDSYYQAYVPNPAFAIIDEEGNLRAESIFTNKVTIERKGEMESGENDLHYYYLKDDEPWKLALDFPLKRFKEVTEEDKNEGIRHYLDPEFETRLTFTVKEKKLPEYVMKALNLE